MAPPLHASRRLALLVAWVVMIGCSAHVAPAAEGAAAGILPPIVFVSRAPVRDEDGEVERGAIPGIGPRDRTARVGGRLLVREPDGSLRVLVDGRRLFDVADPCVSWDGSRVLFSGLAHPDSSWRIYEIQADGDGLRQVTRSDRATGLDQFGTAAGRFTRYDDIDPCWLPDGRICFASTRYPMLAEIGDYPATNLFVVGPDGAHPRRITTERSGAEEPAVDPLTGRVAYSRWLVNLDRPSDVTRDGLTYLDTEALTPDIGNIWETLSITPDGRGARLQAGDPRSRAGLVCYKPALLPDGRVLTLLGANPSFAPSPAGTGVRLFAPGAGPGRVLAGLPSAPDPWSATSPGPPPPPWAADPVALPDGRVLLSCTADGGSDFGLWACALDGSGLVPVLDLPGTHELDAAVLAPAPRAPVLADQTDPETAELPPTEDPATFLRGGSYRFDCLNVFANAPVDAPVPDAPRVTRDTRVRLFLNFQRQNASGRAPSILFRESRLTPRGAVFEQGIPADLPVSGQLLDAEGRILRGPGGAPAHLAGFGFGRHGGWAQCVGCHAGHSVQKIPNNFSAAEWFNASTSARVEASSAWVPSGRTTSPCPGSSVVDRRARSDSLGVAWVAARRQRQSVRLRWPVPIEVSAFVLYGIQPAPARGTDLVLDDCRITLYRRGAVVGRVPTTGRVAPEGTRVTVPAIVVDSVRIELVKTHGRVEGRLVTGLAEVETIARLTLE